MKTTFKEILRHRPCVDGWNKLCTSVFDLEIINEDKKIRLSDEQLNTEVSILEILNINGCDNAFWALRTQKYEDYCLILADIAEYVLYIFEERFPEDNRPRESIQAIRDYKEGKITKEELKTDADAAADAADAAALAADAARAYAAARADAAAIAADAEQRLINEILLRSLLLIGETL